MLIKLRIQSQVDSPLDLTEEDFTGLFHLHKSTPHLILDLYRFLLPDHLYF